MRERLEELQKILQKTLDRLHNLCYNINTIRVATYRQRKETKTMMTTREFYASLTEGATVTAEMAEKAQAMLSKMGDLVDNTELIDKLAEALSDGTARTASEIVALGIGIDNTSKACSVAKAVHGVKIGEKRVGSRIVKTYSL